MAGKLLNRKQLREETEAAERAGAEQPEATKPKAPKRKSRAKVVKEVRQKAYWGVFNQGLKQVAQFEYSQRSQADKRAEELTASVRTPHFVQIVKKVVGE